MKITCSNVIQFSATKTTFHFRLSQLLLGLSVCAAVVIMPGCATYSAGFVAVESATSNRDLDNAIKVLDELKLSGPDETLHHLNKGTLLRLQEKYTESNKHFDAAKVLMKKLSAISLTEQVASVSVNDTLKAYEGLPSEQLMVYSFEALNYLQMGDAEAAAVEARQFDIEQGLISKKYPDAKYLSGAFVRYLNGMVYEAAGDRDAARVEMGKALEGYKKQKSGFPVPQQLETDFKRLDETGKGSANEVVFILHNGLGASIVENNIHVQNSLYNPKDNSSPLMWSLAVPKFVKRSLPVDHVVLSVGPYSAKSEVVEDVSGIAEQSFNDRLPVIIARGVARLVVKQSAAQAVKKQVDNPLFSIVADITTNVSERADTRSWSLLPGNIQMSRLVLPPGKYDVMATYYGAQGNIVGAREFKGVLVKPGQKAFISDYYLHPPAAAKAPN
ncbi:MAG: hypothetical protein WC742_10405 [Gallionellaceae bacterium]|jgi:hypothetical protein